MTDQTFNQAIISDGDNDLSTPIQVLEIENDPTPASTPNSIGMEPIEPVHGSQRVENFASLPSSNASLGGESSTPTALGGINAHRKNLIRAYQYWMDKLVPYWKGRWAFTIFLLFIFALRVYYLSGFYIVAYALAIYMLSLLMGFLTPKIDPSLMVLEESVEEENPSLLPTKKNDEFKPFIRRLPEFKFWNSCTNGTIISIFCTFFEALNVPVYWPILVIYFITLFAVTMKRQIQHMIKHKYVPITNIGKPRFDK